jgi:cobalt transport protein
MGARNLALVACAVFVLALTALGTRGRGVEGDADERAHALAVTMAPGYAPWASPILAPDERQESLFFRLQTATGLVLFGAVVVIAGRRTRRGASHAPASRH